MDKRIKVYNNAETNREVLGDRLRDLSDAVCKSYSPFGSTTIIKNEHGITTTKDGKEILEGMKADDEIAQLILGYGRSVARNTESSGGGDGTTTGTIAMSGLFDCMFLDRQSRGGEIGVTPYEVLSRKGYSNQMISNMTSNIVGKITEKIVANKNKVESLDDVLTIMDIASNGDEKLMGILRESIEELKAKNMTTASCAFRYESTSKIYSSYRMVDGYSMDYVPVVHGMGLDNKWDNCVVISSNDPVNDEKTTDDLRNIIAKSGELIYSELSNVRGVVIIVPSINIGGKQVISELFNTYYKDNKTVPPIFVIEMDEKGESKHLNEYEILHSVMGTISMTPSDIIKDIELAISEGSLDGILPICNMVSTSGYITFTDIKVVNPNIKADKIKYLESLMNIKAGTHEADAIGRVLMSMNKACVTYSLGAKTPDEKKRLMTAMDDVCRSAKSAIDNGYNYGCNSAVLYNVGLLIESDELNDDEKIVAKCIHSAYYFVTSNIFLNAGLNDATQNIVNEIAHKGKPVDVKGLSRLMIDGEMLTSEIIESHMTDRIINPYDADISILEAVTSVVMTLGLSNQILLSDKYEAGKFERGDK